MMNAAVSAPAAEQSFRCTPRTYGGRTVQLWPDDGDNGCISISDIAAHLGKTVYFPESAHAPFTAAQYAAELAQSLEESGPRIQLYGLLKNAHEAYLGHIPPATRAAERWMTTPPVLEDRRDHLERSMRVRILRALYLHNDQVGIEALENMHVIRHMQDRLNATLARDLGAYIHDRRPDRDNITPLPRIITPLRWDMAIEKYVRLYRELAQLSDQPGKK